MDYLLPPITPVAFTGIITCAWIGVFLLLGMFLRSAFPAFRKYLIPSCIIGGVLGLIFQNTGLADATGFGIDVSFLQLLVYHLFCLTWVYIGLRKPEKKSSSSTKETSKKVIWFSGLTNLMTFFPMALAAFGSILLFKFGFNTGPESSGLLISYAFATGPGQALTVATVWENATDFLNLVDLGLASGAMGFAVAITVGIFLVNIIARKKKLEIVTCPSPEEECGYYGECTEKESAGYQTTSVTSIDVLAWHIGIGLVTYFITLIFAVFLFMILPPALRILIWAVFFVFCSLVGICIRTVLEKIGLGHLLCNAMNTRLSNSIVDFMICGTFISIQIGNVLEYSTLFIVSCIISVTTLFVLSWVFIAKLKEESIQTFAFMFGTMSGTISTGFILLRMVDPENKSPVPVQYALGSSLALPLAPISMSIMHLEVLYGYPSWYVAGGYLAISIAFMLICYFFRAEQNEVAWQPDK